MGKFAETKAKIVAEIEATSQKKTFSRAYFDTLATALMNDPEYEKIELKQKNGELVNETTTPMADLRKAVIGSVAKAAGADAAEQERLVDEHTFPTLPLYDFVESSVREYLSLGKKFTFARQEDFSGSLETTRVPAVIKEVHKPGSTEKVKQRQGEHTKLKAKSTCPANLKTNIG